MAATGDGKDFRRGVARGRRSGDRPVWGRARPRRRADGRLLAVASTAAREEADKLTYDVRTYARHNGLNADSEMVSAWVRIRKMASGRILMVSVRIRIMVVWSQFRFAQCYETMIMRIRIEGVPAGLPQDCPKTAWHGAVESRGKPRAFEDACS